MKKVTFLLAFVMIASVAFAQNVIVPRDANKAFEKASYVAGTEKVLDTIFIDEFFNYSTNFYNYLHPDYGYIMGTGYDSINDPGSYAMGNGYIMMGSGYSVSEVLIWTSRKAKISASGSSLEVKLSLVDDSSYYGSSSVSYGIACPGTELATATIPWNNIDTSAAGWTIATFGTPQFVTSDYAITVHFDDFFTNNDTLSIIGGEGSASTYMGLEYIYYLYPVGGGGDFWTQFSHVWTSQGVPIDAALALFPVVDPQSIGENEFVNGIKMSQNYPNPAVNGNTVIDYSVENAGNVSLDIFDITGKVVRTIDEGFKAPGSYKINLETQLPAGTYYYSLLSGKNRLTMKMIVE